MISLLYVSSAYDPFTELQLTDLLSQSRLSNARVGITGMLLYKDGNFMQLIEGEEVEIDALQEKIRLDPRHHGMITLLRKPITERQFGKWSMGFHDLHSPEVRAMSGFSEFLNHDLTGHEFRDHPSQAQKLLLSFKDHM